MTLHIPNLNTLIAHLEAQSPERINMSNMSPDLDCGCILHHALEVFPKRGDTAYDPDNAICDDLYTPPGYFEERHGVRRYPAHRVIATLKRLRDRYLATGEIVVDWGPEPGKEPTQAWRAPQVVEVALITPPALPESLTRILAGQPAAPAVEPAR